MEQIEGYLDSYKIVTYMEPSDKRFPFLCLVLEENKHGFYH